MLAGVEIKSSNSSKISLSSRIDALFNDVIEEEEAVAAKDSDGDDVKEEEDDGEADERHGIGPNKGPS